MRLRTALLATTLLAAAPVAAMAQPVAGALCQPRRWLQPSADPGRALLAHHTRRTAPKDWDGSKSSIRFGDGFTGDGAVGFGFGNGLRTEIQGAYLYNNVNHRGGTPVAGDTSGRDEKYGAFVNVLYDLDLAQFGLALPVTPYVGIGAGYLWEHQGPLSTTYVVSSEDRTGGTQGSFAYQGIIGAAYNIEAVPGLAVTGEYRFVGTTPQTTGSAFSSTAYNPTGIHKGKRRLQRQLQTTNSWLACVMPSTPPRRRRRPLRSPRLRRPHRPAPTWCSSTGTSRPSPAGPARSSPRRRRLRPACRPPASRSTGYTDNSSIHGGERGARYNEGLSIRRADSVKAELVRDGVPATAIDIHGYGESHPLVPTGPNTREPQNRRVEIILH